jgi:hypothetical protein
MPKKSKSNNQNSDNQLKYEDQLIKELRTYDKLNTIKKQNEEHLKKSKKQIGQWLNMHSLTKHIVQLDDDSKASLSWGTKSTSKCNWDELLEKTDMETVNAVKEINTSKPFVMIRITRKKSKNKDVEAILDNV